MPPTNNAWASKTSATPRPRCRETFTDAMRAITVTAASIPIGMESHQNVRTFSTTRTGFASASTSSTAASWVSPGLDRPSEFIEALMVRRIARGGATSGMCRNGFVRAPGAGSARSQRAS